MTLISTYLPLNLHATHHQPALMKYPHDHWIELEHNYVHTMRARRDLMAKYSSHIYFAPESPAAELACRELMEMVFSFLVKRYPRHFSLSRDKTVLTNYLLDKTTNLKTTSPLMALFENVPEDYAIMLRNERDGQYYLRAAVVCSSVGWDIGLHRNAPLSKIHAHVPDADRMAMSMDRWFGRLPTDQPVFRCSWSLEDWEAMFTSPHVAGMEGWTRSAFVGREGELKVGDLKLRCDAQTLRRLPLSGAVVFNFKAIFTPFGEMRREKYVPRLLCTVLEGGKENLIGYKCEEHVRRVAMGALREWADEQVREGRVPADWDVGTLEESPFFPGWEGKCV